LSSSSAPAGSATRISIPCGSYGLHGTQKRVNCAAQYARLCLKYSKARDQRSHAEAYAGNLEFLREMERKLELEAEREESLV
jgi:hypothetical protein